MNNILVLIDFTNTWYKSVEFTVGYARQTLKCAESKKKRLKFQFCLTSPRRILIMAKVDMENISLNKSGIPVFYTNDLT